MQIKEKAPKTAATVNSAEAKVQIQNTTNQEKEQYWKSLMETIRAEKERAAYVLSEEITEMALNLERAEAAMQEITDEFFAAFDDSTEAGRFSIAASYRRYSIFADIVADYLFIIRNALQDLTDKGHTQKYEEGEQNNGRDFYYSR